MKSRKNWKCILFVSCQAVLFGIGGACLPDNLLADTAGGIISDLIVDTFNTLMAGGA